MKDVLYFIGVDGHKTYLSASVLSQKGNLIEKARIRYTDKEAFHKFFSKYRGKAVAAVEAYGYWYWLLDMLEEYELCPVLSNPVQTKAIAWARVKTDSVDSEIIANLLRTDLLPTCWIPSGEIRDKRELIRFRLYLVQIRTGLKNKIHSLLAKYNIQNKFSDLFGKKGMNFLKSLTFNRPETAKVFKMLLDIYEDTTLKIKEFEKRILEICKITPEIKIIDSVPGIGNILAMSIWYETGNILRFPTSKKYTAYCGLAPSVSSSGGKTILGPTSSKCNRWLKYAYIEAAWGAIRVKNSYFRSIYKKLLQRKGPWKAIVAVARVIARTVYQMLKNKQYYNGDLNMDTKNKENIKQFAPSVSTNRV